MASPAPRAGWRTENIAGGEFPQFFESAGRPVYGFYHAPRIERPGAPVLLVCHSLGVEQLTNIRNEVMLARAAAARGFPTFRFHARGHGDSSGNFADVTLETLAEDAGSAAAEAKRLSGAAGIVWLGVRFGARVAARAMRGRNDSVGLILWEPVSRVPDYVRSVLRTLLMSQLASGRRPDATVDQLLARMERDGRVDVHGYFLHRAVIASSEREDLATELAGWTGPTLLVQIQARRSLAPAHEALLTSLGAGGGRIQVEKVTEEPGWHFVSNPAWRSPVLVESTVRWLDAMD